MEWNGIYPINTLFTTVIIKRLSQHYPRSFLLTLTDMVLFDETKHKHRMFLQLIVLFYECILSCHL
ncbi:hypothetical protein C0J52_00567 [Blattella germanica]|nr:hypothetical protein C0J52_00567 [Blattella germanica]